MTSDLPELVVLAGPTASGKTRLAIELALELGAEIVNADSQQVYRHFDLGTAKPTAEELAAVPHHLVSFVDPHDTYSAARFQADADRAIAEIQARGKPVVVVGGTGLYLRILLHGVVAAPSADPVLRAQLEEEAAELGREALHARLASVDPASAEKVKPTDLVRIIRALEIQAKTGRPASELRAEHAFGAHRHPHRLLVLNPERETLYERINLRSQSMYAQGLVEETRRWVEAGFRNAAPMRSVGYAEALQVLDGALTPEQAEAKTAQLTRHYAKRQLTWFRKEPGAIFLPSAELSAVLPLSPGGRGPG